MELYSTNGRAGDTSPTPVPSSGAPHNFQMLIALRQVRRIVESEGETSRQCLDSFGIDAMSKLARATVAIYRDVAFGLLRLEFDFCRRCGLLGELTDTTEEVPNPLSDCTFASTPDRTRTDLKGFFGEMRARVRQLELQFRTKGGHINSNAALVVMPMQDTLNVLLRELYELEALVDRNREVKPLPVPAREYLGE